MRSYNENGAGWAWILGGLGIAGALFWWTHRASAASLPVPTGSVSVARYASARSGIVNAVKGDERRAYGDEPLYVVPGTPPDARRMNDAQIDQITQAWLRQNAAELGPLKTQLTNTGYLDTVAVLSLDPSNP